MKLKVTIGCLLAVVLLTISTPALALSVGASPLRVELEVPSEGSVTTDIKIHYFTGDVQISLIDIPLRIEPSIIHVDALDNPIPIELTIYGDSSLGSQEYDGYIRFVAVSGGAATGGVQVIAKVTNLVDGVPISVPAIPVVPTVTATTLEAVPEVTVEATDVQVVPKTPSVTATNPISAPPGPPVAENQPSAFPLIPVIAGSVGGILVTILVVGIIISRRR